MLTYAGSNASTEGGGDWKVKAEQLERLYAQTQAAAAAKDKEREREREREREKQVPDEC
jgi:hypothetical protein